MLRVLIDQDVDHDILRGLRRRIPQLDAVTALEIGMSEATDPELLTQAAQEGRILVTHDRKSMPKHVGDLMAAGKNIGGVLVVPRKLPLHKAIDDLELIITCSETEEWINLIRYLPL